MFLRITASFAALVALTGVVHAGMGMNYGGHGSGMSGGDFNFAVSSCSGVGMLTADTLNGGGGGAAQLSRRDRNRADILSLFQRPSNFGNIGGVGGGGGAFGGPAGNVGGDRLGIDLGCVGSFGDLRNMIVSAVSSSGDSSNGSSPVNTSYCWCPNIKPGGGDDDDSGDDDDTGDDDDGTNGGGGGGGGPDPSVVPEPSSVALWALFGTLLVSVTRRRD